jgi:NADPH-dependent glutamate synthase beta subunit-like oxidoreductase
MKVLVIGGGLSGVEASLDHAKSGDEIYLVERSPSIGGILSKNEDDILRPKLEELRNSPNTKIITNAAIEDINKDENFDVILRKSAIRIDEEKCDDCGECWKVCPVKAIDRLNEGLSNRNAVYVPYPDAHYLIEKETPFCQATCPVSLDIRGYIGLIADGRFKEAYKLIKEKNPLPGVCGRVCTHPCEDMCKRGIIDEPLAIASLKRFVSDYVYKMEESEKESISPMNGKKIAIIGSGPGGLAAAHDLRMFGYDVTIFEALPKAGGMLVVGIPDYRLPRDILEREIKSIEDIGVEIKTNEKINKDEFENLKQNYDAIFIAVGAHLSRRLGVPGEDLNGVIHGVSFLRDLNLGNEVKIGDRVAVIGGGNVAMDAARSALRLGSKEVFIVYRRSRREMPASEEEIEALEEEGIKIHFLATPIKVIGDGSDAVEHMECIRMELGAPDESGRRRPVPIEGSEFIMDLDTIIPAIGQSSDLSFLEDSDVETPKGRWISADENCITSQSGIFAGGDAVTGPATVIEAIAAGKRAALSIDEYLSGERRPDFKIDENEIDLNEYGDLEKAKLSKHYFPLKEIEKKERVSMPMLPVEERIKDFSEVELGFTEEQALEEAKRCLSCRKCIGCGICAEVCEKNAIEYDQKDEMMALNVSKIILAPEPEEITPKTEDGHEYVNIANMVTSIEFERILSKNGPYGGIIMRPYDGEIPKEIAFMMQDDSSISSIYVIKEAINVNENGLKARVFFKSIKDEYKRYYEDAKEKGVEFIKADLLGIKEDEDKNLVLRYTINGEEKEERFGMVVLSPGFDLPRHEKRIGDLIGVKLEEYDLHIPGEGEYTVSETKVPGVFVAGWK